MSRMDGDPPGWDFVVFCGGFNARLCCALGTESTLRILGSDSYKWRVSPGISDSGLRVGCCIESFFFLSLMVAV